MFDLGALNAFRVKLRVSSTQEKKKRKRKERVKLGLYYGRAQLGYVFKNIFMSVKFYKALSQLMKITVK